MRRLLRSTGAFAASMLAQVFGQFEATTGVDPWADKRPPEPAPPRASSKQKAHRHHQPERAGEGRARLRLAQKLHWNQDNIPDTDRITRQRQRAAERAAAKKRRVTPAEAGRRAMDAQRRERVLARQARAAREVQA